MLSGQTKPFLSAVIAFSALTLAGCVPFPVYTVSSSNITTIRDAKAKLELGEFKGEHDKVTCRLQGITPDGGRTFAQYIKDAVRDEVVIAGNTTAMRSVRISLELKDIDVMCNVGTGNWSFEVEVKIGSQAPFVIKSTREFDGNFLGAVVYQRAYQAFVPAVQKLIADIMAHPSFKAETGS